MVIRIKTTSKMKKILFIEDEEALQKTLGNILSKEYEVIKALDGQSGLDLAKKEKPDLILLDLILPKMNGFDVLKNLKNDPATKDIPIIILTNLDSVVDIDKALSLGAKTYLVKANYSLEEIAEKIREDIGD